MLTRETMQRCDDAMLEYRLKYCYGLHISRHNWQMLNDSIQSDRLHSMPVMLAPTNQLITADNKSSSKARKTISAVRCG